MRSRGTESVRVIVFLGILLGSVVLGVPTGVAEDGAFSSAAEGYPWSFPRDHGRHSSFATEWWYYTGQVYDEGREPFRDPPSFGYQLTFFRRGSVVGEGRSDEYMAHAALTDISRGRTHFSQRVGGGAFGAAGVSGQTLRAWSGDWSADLIGASHLLRYSLPIDGGELMKGGLFVRLQAVAKGEPWFQGEAGFSRKGECQGCASMYYSYPDLTVAGVIESPQGVRRVAGVGWMDHEFMSNSLGERQQGWDWLSVMLRDGRRLMLFQVRSTDDSPAYLSGGILEGKAALTLEKGDFSVTPLRRWKSPRSGAEYPVAWRIVVPSGQIDIEVAARVEDCEVGGEAHPSAPRKPNEKGTAPLYWEGPIAAGDESAIGYLEMTGYASKIRL